MTDLSPAAQAVLDAYWTFADSLDRDASDEEVLAAALRAAADQVVPEPSDHLPEQNCRWYRLGVSAYRHNILAIATELKAHR